MRCRPSAIFLDGGQTETGGSQPRRYFPRIRKAYLIGQRKGIFSDARGQGGLQISDTLDVGFQTRRAPKPPGYPIRGAAVAGCASFDQYAISKSAGNRFANLVLALRREAVVDHDSCPGRVRHSSCRSAERDPGFVKQAGPRLCSAPLRKCYALRCARETQGRIPSPINPP